MSKLREAYELIQDPKHWTTRVAARDRYRHEVEPDSVRATRWCAIGALYHVGCDQLDRQVLDETAYTLFHEPFGVVRVNDVLGHEAVMQVFEKALVEREGSL